MQRSFVLLGFVAATAAIVACQDSTAPKQAQSPQGETEAWRQNHASSIHGTIRSFVNGRDSGRTQDSTATPVQFASVTIIRLSPMVDSVPPDSVCPPLAICVPRDTVPRDTVPRDTVPRDTVPRDTVPRDTIPRDTIPRDTIPRDTIPRDTTHRDSLPHPDTMLMQPSRLRTARVARLAQTTPPDSGSMGTFACGQHVTATAVVSADASGVYTAGTLEAGIYAVQVSAPGYATVTACNLPVAKGQSMEVNLYLQKVH